MLKQNSAGNESAMRRSGGRGEKLRRTILSTERIRLAAGITAAVAAGLLTFRFTPYAFGPPGIDAGWQWVVNVAAENGWAFGRDVVFTYGPLGWLATPQDSGHNLMLAAAFRVFLQTGLIAAVIGLTLRDRRPVAALAFAVLWIAGHAVGLRFEGWVCLVVATALVHTVRTGALWSAAFAGVVAGISSMIKASLGLATMATVLIAIALIWRRQTRTEAAVAGCTAILSVAILAVVLFPTPGVFISWVAHSRDIVVGYAAAASILGPYPALLAGFFLLVVNAAAGLLGARRSPDFAVAAALLAPSLAVHFRLAFVRQDGHQYLFVPFVVAMLGVAALSAPRRSAQACLIAGGVAALLIGSLSGALPKPPTELPRAVLGGISGPTHIRRLLHPIRTRHELKEASRRNLEGLRLPVGWADLVRTSPHGMTVVPWEIMYAPANNLPFQPLRSMQLYSAYTEGLDRWTAAGLTAEDGPDFVLDDFAPVGKRRALLDAPATWRTLLTHYELEAFNRQRGLLLLKRRPQPVVEHWRDLGRGQLEIGGPGLNVPDPGAMVFAEANARLNVFGRINKMAFRVPLLMAVFHHRDGTSSWARFIPATAGNGILVSRFPHSIDDYANLWRNVGSSPVARFQVIGPGGPHYQPEITVRWKALDF